MGRTPIPEESMIEILLVIALLAVCIWIPLNWKRQENYPKRDDIGRSLREGECENDISKESTN